MTDYQREFMERDREETLRMIYGYVPRERKRRRRCVLTPLGQAVAIVLCMWILAGIACLVWL